MASFKSNQWALILGGSSGFGLATAKKLANHGMNLCLVHRDRKGAMKLIEPHFEELKAMGTQVLTFNVNALAEEGMTQVVDRLSEALGSGGKIRLLLHSIAYGNLKLQAPEPEEKFVKHDELIKDFSAELGVKPEQLQASLDKFFNDGHAEMQHLASPPAYDNESLLKDEDYALTIYSMGSSLATWVSHVFRKDLFASDARVIGLTSEGNEVAWKGYAAVSAAKVALEAIARSIAVEYAPYGIRANIIQAGVTDTPALRLIPGSQHLKAAAKMRNPFKRITTPEDVASFIYLMCLDEAAWANGNIIRVDGGEHISG